MYYLGIMQHLEIVHLSPLNSACRNNALKKAMEISVSRKGESHCLDVWANKEQEGDIVILLILDSIPGEGAYSTEGLQIAKYFSRFGWISHTHWTKELDVTSD